jgi:serine/threonine protein phosphatase 1
MLKTINHRSAFFVIGDVHGCFYSFLKLLECWKPKQEKLIQLGDLIDSGNHSSRVLRLATHLNITFQQDVFFLRGNHEHMMIKYLQGDDQENNWIEKGGGKKTLQEFERRGIDPKIYLDWLKELPLIWSNGLIQISHAGIAEDAPDPYDSDAPNSVVWNRSPLLNTGKIQIIGHTPLTDGKPAYDAQSNSWNIDTGAYKGICLTGIKLNRLGNIIQTISIPTDQRDIT